MKKSEKIKYIVISVIFFIVGFLVGYLVFLDKEVYDSLEMEEGVGGAIQGNIDTLNQEQDNEIKPRQEITYIVSPETGAKLKSVEVDYDVSGNITQERYSDSVGKITREKDYFYRNDGKIDYILNKDFLPQSKLNEESFGVEKGTKLGLAIISKYEYDLNDNLISIYTDTKHYGIDLKTNNFIENLDKNPYLPVLLDPGVTEFEYYEDNKLKKEQTRTNLSGEISIYYYRNDGKIDYIENEVAAGVGVITFNNKYFYNNDGSIDKIEEWTVRAYDGSGETSTSNERISRGYTLYSYNPNGTLDKKEIYNSEDKLREIVEYIY